jgi:mono/diheme cytochrome c family protein
MRSFRTKLLRATIVASVLATFAIVVPSASAQGSAEKNYAKNCVACHGADGSANVPAGKATKARDFHSPDVQNQTDDALAAIIAKGKGAMPMYEKQLKPDEIKDLVAYVRKLGKQK